MQKRTRNTCELIRKIFTSQHFMHYHQMLSIIMSETSKTLKQIEQKQKDVRSNYLNEINEEQRTPSISYGT